MVFYETILSVLAEHGLLYAGYTTVPELAAQYHADCSADIIFMDAHWYKGQSHGVFT